MSTESENPLFGCLGVFIVLLVVMVPCLAWNWYKAGVHQEVYRRQGCEMSRWEILMGAKPIDRQLVQPK